MKVDLHCHSYFSDGSLSPKDVVDLAKSNGVDVLALTDHDSVQGLDEAREQSKLQGIRLIDGVEISVSWNKRTIHMVGLNIIAEHQAMTEL